MEDLPERIFRGWQYLESREPWGDRRLDVVAGLITAGIRNGWLNKGQKPYGVVDFMPDWDGFRQMSEASTPEELHSKFLLIKDDVERAQKKKQSIN